MNRKRLIVLVIVGIVFTIISNLVFVANAYGQETYGDPCAVSKGQRMGKVGLSAGGGAVLGWLLGGKKGAAIGGAALGGVQSAREVFESKKCRSQQVKRDIAPRGTSRDTTSNATPDLRGRLMAVCFKHGTRCEPARQGIEELIEANAGHSFSQLGVRMLRTPSDLRGNPCEYVREEILCVSYGTAVQYGDTYGSGNTGINITHTTDRDGKPVRNPWFGGSQSGGTFYGQREAMIVSVDLYDNIHTITDERRREYPTIVALANATGFGDRQSGQNFLSSQNSGRNGSIFSSGYSGLQNGPQFAEFDAARRATALLVNGRGWLPTAERDLNNSQ